MKNITLAAVALLFTASLASAQGYDTESVADSQSYSGVTIEGTTVPDNTPGLGSVGGNSTAPCVIAQGLMVSGPGAGIGYSNGRLDKDCVTRTEASILRDIAGMPNGPQKTAAVMHFCTNDESMRNTLIGLGLCAPKATRTVSSATVSTRSASNLGTVYSFCGRTSNGTFTVKAKAGKTNIAGRVCTADFKANGGKNIGSY